MDLQSLETALISLLLIIAVVAVGIRFLRVPYPIALVITGLALGAVVRSPPPFVRDLELQQIRLTPDLILLLLLPPLLFEATLHIEATALRKTLAPIAVLAVPGVLLTAGIVGALVHWGIGLDWPTSLLFGAIVAATDPIAVLAVFKRLGAPHGLELLVEGESLFNDGTAVVLANILKTVVLAGTFSLLDGALSFGLVVGGGLIVGLLTGWLVSQLTARIDDHLVEITFTTILTFGTYLVAEALHVSGVIAVVAAGLVLGNVGAKHGMSPRTRLSLLNFWEYVAFVINSLIFLLIGLQVEFAGLADNVVPIVIAIGAVLLARAIIVYGLGLAILPLPRVLPLRWLHTLFWAGLRGAVSLAVALALPFNLPTRSLLLDLTFGVVLWTLLVQGLTMEPLLKRLKLVGINVQRAAYESRRAQLLMVQTARRELQRLADQAVLAPRVFKQLDEAYQATGKALADELEGIYQSEDAFEQEELRSVREHLLRVELAALRSLQRRGLVNSETARALAEVVDARLLALRADSEGGLSDDPVVSELEPLDDMAVVSGGAAAANSTTARPPD